MKRNIRTFHLLLQFPAMALLALLIMRGEALSAQEHPVEPAQQRDGSRDFDFAFGDWSAHISRLQSPLSGADDWVDYQGTLIVRKVWSGRANLGEFNVSGPAGSIQGLSLRTYNPQTGQWHISWANSRTGEVGPPMVGGFRNGIGEFYNQEIFNDRYVFVRFVFSDIKENTFRLEQAFSADGGKAWETNWIARFEKQ